MKTYGIEVCETDVAMCMAVSSIRVVPLVTVLSRVSSRDTTIHIHKVMAHRPDIWRRGTHAMNFELKSVFRGHHVGGGGGYWRADDPVAWRRHVGPMSHLAWW